MNEELDFLTVQGTCLKYIFEHVFVIDLRLKSLKKNVKNKHLILESKHDILSIENYIRIADLLIKEFNQSKFGSIMKMKLDDDLAYMVYSGRSKLTKVNTKSRKKKK